MTHADFYHALEARFRMLGLEIRQRSPINEQHEGWRWLLADPRTGEEAWSSFNVDQLFPNDRHNMRRTGSYERVETVDEMLDILADQIAERFQIKQTVQA